IGVKPGDSVAVLDWDSHRYLECYFAVPMMGAVLQTVNLSLPGLLFAMNDAAPSTVLVNADFLPLMEKLADKLPSVQKCVLLHDRKEQPTTRLPIECEYEEVLEANSPFFQFCGFRREHPRDDISYDRNDGPPERGVLQPPSARAAHARYRDGIWPRSEPGTDSPGRRLHAVDADVPR